MKRHSVSLATATPLNTWSKANGCLRCAASIRRVGRHSGADILTETNAFKNFLGNNDGIGGDAATQAMRGHVNKRKRLEREGKWRGHVTSPS